MANYGFTLHSIMRSGSELPISTVQEFTDADYADMLRLGAIRMPTSDELALAKMGFRTVEEPTLFDPKPAEPDPILLDPKPVKQSRKAKKEEDVLDPDVDDSIF